MQTSISPVFTPASKIRSAYEACIAAGPIAAKRAAAVVRSVSVNSQNSIASDLLRYIKDGAMWATDREHLPRTRTEPGITDSIVVIRRATGGKWSKSRRDKRRVPTPEEIARDQNLLPPCPTPDWSAKDLAVIRGHAGRWGGIVYAEDSGNPPREGKASGNVIAGRRWRLPRVREDSEGVSYVIDPELVQHGIHVYRAWHDKQASWLVIFGFRSYHCQRDAIPPEQAVVKAIDDWRKQRNADRQAAIKADSLRSDYGHIYVSREDSLAVGNCAPITDQFAQRAWGFIGAAGPCAVRADIVLALRDDSYTRRACQMAASRVAL